MSEREKSGVGGDMLWSVLVAMLHEEWRLHRSLFGGQRFAAYPVLITSMVAVASVLLGMVGVAESTVVFGVFTLVFVFGLHTGSIGLIGRDAIRNLLGDVTLLVFSARTLPLDSKQLVGVFVLKDVLYYAGLFIAPISIGLLPILASRGVSFGLVWSLIGLWGALTMTFVLGLLMTMAGIGLSDFGTRGRVVLLGGTAVLVASWWFGIDVVSFSPVGLYVNPGVVTLLKSVAVLLTVGGVAMLSFNVSSSTRNRSSRTGVRGYDRLNARVRNPIASKSLLDVHRSSGGILKFVFSGVILFAVAAAMIVFVERITLVRPSTAVTFGILLGFTGFTSYNWVTQFDDLSEYVIYPTSVREVFAGKFQAFLLVGLPTTMTFYLIAVVWRETTLTAGVFGGVLAVGMTIYTGGLTMYVAGLSPNEFLFDTVAMASLWVGIAVPVVPLLVLGFVYVPLSITSHLIVGAWAVVLGFSGIGLERASLEKWESYHRNRG